MSSQYTFLSDGATESDLRDLKNELEIMHSVGHHLNLVNLIGACSSGGESALKSQIFLTLSPEARFSKAPETFRARKAIFSSSVSENGEVYTPEENLCLY